MNLLNLPVFIVLLAITYLTIIYGLLKIIEAQTEHTTVNTDSSTVDSKQRVEIPWASLTIKQEIEYLTVADKGSLPQKLVWSLQSFVLGDSSLATAEKERQTAGQNP